MTVIGIWSIYRLRPAVSTAFTELEEALRVQNENSQKPQITMLDVYELARLGETLTAQDFDRFRNFFCAPASKLP